MEVFFNNYSQQGDIFLHSVKRNLIPFSWNKEGQVTLSKNVTWEFAFALYIKHSFIWNITVSLKTAEEFCITNRKLIFLLKAPAAALHAESVNGMERRSCLQYRWKNWNKIKMIKFFYRIRDPYTVKCLSNHITFRAI